MKDIAPLANKYTNNQSWSSSQMGLVETGNVWKLCNLKIKLNTDQCLSDKIWGSYYTKHSVWYIFWSRLSFQISMFYRTFGLIYILKSSVLLHFCRSGPTVFGKSGRGSVSICRLPETCWEVVSHSDWQTWKSCQSEKYFAGPKKKSQKNHCRMHNV